MDNEYIVDVKGEFKGRLKIIASSGDEVCDKITKQEGFDPNCDVEDLRITDVEMIRIVHVEKCEETEK